MTRTFLIYLLTILHVLGWSGSQRVARGGDRDSQPDTGGTGGVAAILFSPPAASDVSFVVDSGAGLDTGCTFRSGSPLLISIPVDRYLGEVWPDDGTLVHAESLKTLGYLKATATVFLPAWDVDLDSELYPPERDEVRFNGVPVGSLRGANQRWEGNAFEVPIELVKFPSARGADGQRPTPAVNTLRIDIDIGNTGWCTAIDWVALQIGVMSPIVLIHGNSQQGGFWDEKPGNPYNYETFSKYFGKRYIVYDNSISLSPPHGNQSRKLHAWQLYRAVRGVVKSLGVDSVHLIAHSKGGLDAREYLATHYAQKPRDFTVLSLTTLSTPHEGSVLADYVESARIAANPRVIPYSGAAAGVDLATVAMSYLAALFPNPAHMDLITYTFPADKDALLGERPGAPGFAEDNIRALPTEIMYNRIGADADTNASSDIDLLTEWWAMARDAPELARLSNEEARVAVNNAYRLLRRFRTAPFERVGNQYRLAPVQQGTRPNDCATTIRSAFACDLFWSFHGLAQASGGCSKMFTGAAGRNHSTVADSGVAADVFNWLRCREIEAGDLDGLSECPYGWCDMDANTPGLTCGR